MPLRVIDLYVHFHMVMFSRAQTKKRFFGDVDWSKSSNSARLLLSEINKVARDAYTARIEATLRQHEDIYENTKYSMSSIEMRAIWGTIKTATKAYRAAGFTEESIYEEFKKAADAFSISHY